MRAVGAVILAAGGSTRLGRPKQLLVFKDETLVRRAVRAATEAGCRRLVVVTGETREEIAADLRATPAQLVHNPTWQRGLGTSIRCGLCHLLEIEPDLEAVVLLTCDQPFVDATVILRLVDCWNSSGRPIVASAYAHTVGIPGLFDKSSFAALLDLADESGAKPLLESNAARVATIAFKDGAIDIDTPAEAKRFTS